MLNRNNIFLVALLVVQVVLLALTIVATGGAESRTVEVMLTGMAAAEIERITFVDDQDQELTLARSADGWVLPAADDFPVNGEQVDEILDKIAGMTTSRLVASNPANFARLEVKDDDFRRKLTLESGDASQVLYLGGSGGVDTVYTRRAGADEVYLGVGLSSWELSTLASSWIDTSYVNVTQDDVIAITIHNANGSFTLQRADGEWSFTDLPEGETLEDTRIPSILRNAASIRMVEPLGLEALDAYELADPQVTVDVRYRLLIESEVAADDAVADAETSDEEAVAMKRRRRKLKSNTRKRAIPWHSAPLWKTEWR